MTKAMNLTDTLDKIHEDIDGKKIKVTDIVEALEHRGFGPLILAASLMTILPTGGIPGVPTVTGLLIILISAQLLFGKKKPWVPSKLREMAIKKEKFENARDTIRPYTKKIDKLIKPRYTTIVENGANRVIAALSIILAISMPFLEIIPFAAFVPAFAIGLMAIGLSAKDGVFVMIGCAVALIGIPACVFWVW